MYQMALPSTCPHSILNSIQGLAHNLQDTQQISYVMFLYFVGWNREKNEFELFISKI